MSLARFIRAGRPSSDGPVPLIVADVRKVGANVFEAHDSDGYYCAVAMSPEDAVAELRKRLPPHDRLFAWYPGAARSVEVRL